MTDPKRFINPGLCVKETLQEKKLKNKKEYKIKEHEIRNKIDFEKNNCIKFYRN